MEVEPAALTADGYRAIFDALDEGLVHQCHDGSIAASNVAATRILGLTAEQLSGRTSIDPRWRSVHEDGSPFPGEEHPAMLTLADGRARTGMIMGIHQPDGHLRWLRVSSTPLATEDGQPAVLTTFLDITTERLAEEALAASARQVRSIVDTVGDAILLFEADGAVRFVNAAARAHLGWEHVDDVPPFSELVHPDDRGRVQLAVRGRSGLQDPIEIRVRRADGSYALLECIANNLLDDPAVAAVVVTARDLNDRHRVERELDTMATRLRVLVDSLPSAVCVEDDEHRVILVNQRFRELFVTDGGPDSTGVVGGREATIAPLVPDREGWSARLAEVIEAGVDVTGDELVLVDGRTIERDFRAITVDGVLRERVFIFRDITASKAAAAALAAARDEALDLSRAKTDFLATLSHEIRTPMNGIVGMVDLLGALPLDRDLLDLIGGVRTAADSMMDMLDDILDLARIEAGSLDLDRTSIDVRDVVEGVAETFVGAARERGLSLATEVDPSLPAELLGDRSRLRQVLINLVGNALKFTDTGEVVVRARRGSASDEVLFEVVDTGPGVEEGVRVDLFRPFTQVDMGTNRTHGGAGLGLAISARLVEAMGGVIGYEPAPGRGTRFWFTAVLPGSGPPHDLPDGLAGRRAHIAVQPPMAGKAVAGTLRGLGLDVTLVMGGDEPSLADGDLFVTTDPELGPANRVVVQLPVRTARLAALCAGEAEVASLPAVPETLMGRVLVAEDNAINRAIAVRSLARLGLEVESVDGGLEAVEAVSAGGFDVVLMDCHMPGVDGYEATRRIRMAEGQGPRVPIVALTASTMPGDRERCIESGMDDYVAKPITLAGLRRALTPWLAAAGPDVLATVRAVDHSVLDDLAAELDDEVVVATFVHGYLRELAPRIDAMRRAIATGDATSLVEVAHTLKGSSAAMGAHGLVTTCLEIEALGRSGDLTGAAELGLRIDAEAADVAAELRPRAG